MGLEQIIVLCLIFFLIATLYSAVGLGGGSSYLAVLSLFGIAFLELKSLALICNIIVVLNSSILFSSSGLLKWPNLGPLILLSIPMAYFGATVKLEERTFFILLGITLFFAAIAMSLQSYDTIRKLPRFSNAFIGGGIGFISGMVGIGGGIFLAPILHLSKWDRPKVIAATTALFILVNSIAAIVGLWHQESLDLNFQLTSFLILAVLLGSQLGVRITLTKLNAKSLRKLSALVILFVALRILYTSI